MNVPDPELSRQVRELLLARDAPNERLRRLISLLDSSASMVLLTQMVVALGRVLVAKHRWKDDHAVVATVRAGQRYSEDPTPEHYRDYFESATSSYPFGTGDGCYAMEGSQDCTIGTGCPSGSGTLESIAQDLGADVVLQVLRDEKVSRGGW